MRSVNDINRAIVFAARAHQNQLRKQEDIPYITHPFAVALLLQKEGASEEVIIAGLLHDTIEDTAVTLEDIRTEFGDRVARIVEGCSEPDRSAPWEERKRHTIEYLRQAPYEVKLVSCADKLHNILSIHATLQQIGERVWERFHRGYELQKWYYTALVESLFHGLDGLPEDSIFYQYRDMVHQVFGK